MLQKMVKRLTALVMAMVMCSVTALAAPGPDVAKTATLLNSEENSYKVSLAVPGEGNARKFVLMMDASESMQSHNWNDTLRIIRAFGERVLAEKTPYHEMTVVSFGMNADATLKFTTKDDLKQLDNIQAEDLLYGVSATNVEGALDYVRWYIDTYYKMDKSYIICITDGETNMSEEPYFWQNAQEDEAPYLSWHYRGLPSYNLLVDGNNGLAQTIEMVASGKVDDFDPATKAFMAYCGIDLVQEAENGTLLATLKDKTMPYTNKRTGVYDAAAPIYRIWSDMVFEAVYREEGLTYALADDPTGTSISKAARAFIKYDIKYYKSDGHSSTLVTSWYFLLLMYGRVGSFVDNRPSYNGYRALLRTNNLLERGSDIHFFRFRSRRPNEATNWMDPLNTNNPNWKSMNLDPAPKLNLKPENYHGFEDYSSIASAIDDLVQDVLNTTYYDAYITDYISKWVTLKPGTIKIYDDTEDKLIWTEKQGWLIPDAERPVQGNPVTVELVPPSEYAAGGSEVAGNTSGDVHKITWHIKDGPLTIVDRYHLEYEVLADTQEEGFAMGTDYPTNGTTEITHYPVPSGGDPVTNPIEVPEVHVDGTVPATGDVATPVLWLGMMIIALAGAAMIRKRRLA